MRSFAKSGFASTNPETRHGVRPQVRILKEIECLQRYTLEVDRHHGDTRVFRPPKWRVKAKSAETRKGKEMRLSLARKSAQRGKRERGVCEGPAGERGGSHDEG